MRKAAVLLGAVLVTAAASNPAFAKKTDREYNTEMTLKVGYADRSTWTFDSGADVAPDSAGEWGFGIAYNFSKRVALGVDFGAANFDYTARIVNQSDGTVKTTTGRAQTYTVAGNATYYFLAKTLTPYITGRIGGTHIDTGSPAAGTINGCYWFWGGYACSDGDQTDSQWVLNLGAGVGVRWEASRASFIKLGIDRTWLDLPNASGTPSKDTARLDFGFRF